MGSFADVFSFKTRKQRERDAKNFDRWAFPYGDPQRQKLIEILKELLPKEDPKAALAVYLFGRYKKFIPYYKALVLADAQVDETLNYPSVEELRRRAEELA